MLGRAVAVLLILALALKELQASKTGKKQLVSVQHFLKGSSGPREHICGGVLLTRRVVLTACSCVTKVRKDPTTSRSSAILMDPERIVVYIGSAMDTKSTRGSGVQRVKTMFTHPLCDSDYSYDFALIITQHYFNVKGLIVVKTLHKPDRIREFVIGRLDFPRACSTFSWMADNTTAPCVNLEFNEKKKVSIDDLADILEMYKMRSIGNRIPTVKRTKRKALEGGFKVVVRTIPTNYFAKNRMDVDFVDKKYCTSLVSDCAMDPHGCISGIHGLRCDEWCMRSLDCTDRLCLIDTGSPVFCNKVQFGPTRSKLTFSIIADRPLNDGFSAVIIPTDII